MAATKKKPAAKAAPTLVRQGAKFGVVGISNTLIDYAIYIAVTKLLNVPLDRVFVVKFFSGTVAMVNSFYWNRKWTFRSKAGLGRSGSRFLIATLVSVYVIQPGMVYLFSGTAAGQNFATSWFDLAQVLGLERIAPMILTQSFVIKTIAFGMGVIGSAIWNFTLYKLWAFKD